MGGCVANCPFWSDEDLLTAWNGDIEGEGVVSADEDGAGAGEEGAV